MLLKIWRTKGRFAWSPKSQVPLMLASPNMEKKYQLLNLKKPLKYGRLPLKSDLGYFMQKYLWDLCWELNLALYLIQLSPQVPSLTSKKCCHVGIHVILGTHDLRPPVWSGKSQLSSSQRLRLHRLTSSDLGLGTRVNLSSSCVIFLICSFNN